MAFVKFHESILDSSIWRESAGTRLIWVTMLAMANREGEVMASVPGLADRAKVSLGECVTALGVLKAPDEWSRSREYEGRRIEEIDGGWRLLNYQKYRLKGSPENVREKARIRQAKFREKQRLKNGENLAVDDEDLNAVERAARMREKIAFEGGATEGIRMKHNPGFDGTDSGEMAPL